MPRSLAIVAIVCLLCLSQRGVTAKSAGAAQAALTQLTDEQIQSAIQRGEASVSKALWKQIEKRHRIKLTKGGLVDHVEKFVTFFGDLDRIALIAANRKRRLQATSVDYIRASVPMGITEVRLQSAAIGVYAGSLPKWTAPAVHVVLTVDGTVVQPDNERAGASSRTVIGQSQTGIVQHNGPFVTYTPLYSSSAYDVSSADTWFRFPVTSAQSSLKITVIPSEGRPKEKNLAPEILK
jgi:hypothetical protein